MSAPVTQQEYETAEKVLRELLAFNEKHEPHAVRYIRALETILENFGGDVEEVFTVYE